MAFISLAGLSVVAANTETTTLSLSPSTIQLLLAASVWFADVANWRADDAGTQLDEIEVDIVNAIVEVALAEITP